MAIQSPAFIYIVHLSMVEKHVLAPVFISSIAWLYDNTFINMYGLHSLIKV